MTTKAIKPAAVTDAIVPTIMPGGKEVDDLNMGELAIDGRAVLLDVGEGCRSVVAWITGGVFVGSAIVKV